MTRVLLSPVVCGWQLYLHIFHREDFDRDPHDHPFGFWTFPINQGYTEEVFDSAAKCFTARYVPRLRWSYRPATHTHRVISCDRGWPLLTIVARGQHERDWGFWCHKRVQASNDPARFWIRWQSYMRSGGSVVNPGANIQGRDDACPGNGG